MAAVHPGALQKEEEEEAYHSAGWHTISTNKY
jgi:hypothetical protein